MSSSALQHKASLMQRRLLEEGARYVISRWPRSRGNCSRIYCGGSMDCDRGQPQRSNWSGCVITTEGVYLNAGKGSAGSTTSQYLDSQSLIVRRMLHPIWVCIDKLMRLVRELSIKRGRTEVSASFNLAAPVPSAGTLKTLKI